MTEEVLKATTTLNNLKQHNFTIGDYKMCPQEAEICQRALKHYIDVRKFDYLEKPLMEMTDEATV